MIDSKLVSEYLKKPIYDLRKEINEILNHEKRIDNNNTKIIRSILNQTNWSQKQKLKIIYYIIEFWNKLI